VGYNIPDRQIYSLVSMIAVVSKFLGINQSLITQ
jgi:hypothetical protein